MADFRRKRGPLTPVVALGEGVEMANTYKFLGVQLNIKLDLTDNTDALYRRRLISFNVCTTLLQMFYQSMVAMWPWEPLDKLMRKARSWRGWSWREWRWWRRGG